MLEAIDFELSAFPQALSKGSLVPQLPPLDRLQVAIMA